MRELGRRRWIPISVLAASLGLTAAGAVSLHLTARSKDRLRFESRVQHTEANIRSALDTYVALLRATGGLFDASQYVSRDEFHAFIEHLELRQRYPGIQGIGFSRRIPTGTEAAVEERMRREGAPSFHLWPRQPRAEYHSILYLEPDDPRNEAALGFDMSSEPTRRAAMERARDTGLPAASGKVSLVQEPGQAEQAGFLLYVPVYRGGRTPPTVEERRQALAGFVYGPFRADDLLAGVFGAEPPADLAFEVYDGGRVAPERLLHRSTGAGRSEDPRFYIERTLDVAGQPWLLAFEARPAFGAGSSRKLLFLVIPGGLAVSLLLFSIAHVQARARAIAEQHTEDVRRLNAELERRVAERTSELRDTVRELETFTYTVAHDLRAPLRTVYRYSQVLLEDYEKVLDETGCEYARAIQSSSRRMDTLIENLLAYSRLTRAEVRVEPLDLRKALADVLDQLSMEIRDRGGQVELVEPIPTVRGNRVLVEQILTNLITNALKFVKPGVSPRVNIRAEVRGEQLRLWVEDNGIGIDPKYRERLFRVFERLHIAEQYAGTGIGLAIVRRAAERMRGRADFESRVGEGSQFWVELPLADAGQSAAA